MAITLSIIVGVGIFPIMLPPFETFFATIICL
jgi:hypothetical protein